MLLIRSVLVMVPVVLLINGFSKGDWIDATLFALAVAVGLTLEMLPMIVSSNLAKGAMARRKVDCQTAERRPEPWRDGSALHRQNRHPDAG